MIRSRSEATLAGKGETIPGHLIVHFPLGLEMDYKAAFDQDVRN